MTEIDWIPFLLSGKLALLTTVILVILVAPLAYVLTFARFPGKGLCEALLNLPLLLPPTVLGFYLLLIMGPKGVVGRLWAGLTEGSLVFSFSGIVFASGTLYFFMIINIRPYRVIHIHLNHQK